MPIGFYYRFKMSTIIQIYTQKLKLCMYHFPEKHLKIIVSWWGFFFKCCSCMLSTTMIGEREIEKDTERERFFSAPTNVTANLTNH